MTMPETQVVHLARQLEGIFLRVMSEKQTPKLLELRQEKVKIAC